MINAITDLIQSFAILLSVIMWILLTRRVNRLDRRIDGQPIIYRSLEVQDPQPICGCGHHQCFHDETGCDKQEIMSHFRRIDGSYGEYERETVPCGCKRYTGPEQLPQVIP